MKKHKILFVLGIGIGILIGIYIVKPQVILDFVDKVKIWFLTIKK